MSYETSMDMALYNNFSYKNLDYGFRFQKAFGTGVTTLRNNISYKDRTAYEGRPRNVYDHNSWNSGAPAISDADFVSLDMTQLARPRKSDGSLPDTDFSRLKSASKLIDAGIMIGLVYGGTAPDLGAFETLLAAAPAPAPTVVSYKSSKVEDATPGIIGVSYSSTLASIIPPVSSYSVKVNSVTRTISKLAISGSSVLITLATPVVYGDIVTVAYAKPTTNPLQCVAATQAVTIIPQTVLNGVQPKGTVTTDPTSSTNQISIYPNPVREYINISCSEPVDGQIVKIYDRSGRLRFEQALAASSINRVPVNLEKGIYIVNIMSGTVIKYAQKLVVI
jgi:hypothetical protein